MLAPRDVPERRRASRDGYAVAAADVGGASPYAPVRLLATPFWVEAGDDLPDGTDAVLPPEGLEGRDAVSDVFVHEGVRERADDLSSGDVVVASGERIASRHVLALALCALSEIRVRRPRVTLIVTGAPGPEALSAFLTAAIAREGGTARTVAVPDSEDAIAAAILDTDAMPSSFWAAPDSAVPISAPPALPALAGSWRTESLCDPARPQVSAWRTGGP